MSSRFRAIDSEAKNFCERNRQTRILSKTKKEINSIWTSRIQLGLVLMDTSTSSTLKVKWSLLRAPMLIYRSMRVNQVVAPWFKHHTLSKLRAKPMPTLQGKIRQEIKVLAIVLILGLSNRDILESSLCLTARIFWENQIIQRTKSCKTRSLLIWRTQI